MSLQNRQKLSTDYMWRYVQSLQGAGRQLSLCNDVLGFIILHAWDLNMSLWKMIGDGLALLSPILLLEILPPALHHKTTDHKSLQGAGRQLSLCNDVLGFIILHAWDLNMSLWKMIGDGLALLSPILLLEILPPALHHKTTDHKVDAFEVMMHSHFNGLFRQNHFRHIRSDDHTVIICDQELPADKWFRCEDGNRIYISLVDHYLKGAEFLQISVVEEYETCRKEGLCDCRKVVPEKPKSNVHKPLELLASIDVPEYVLKVCYLIPSMMHDLESLLSASQLHEETALPAVHIPKILEALATTLSCCEMFPIERLELLGYLVWKYTMSCYLLLKYLEKARREAICKALIGGLQCKVYTNSV
ncbi:Endoribonuclease Dicer homolog 3-like protein [Drosera capensis]